MNTLYINITRPVRRRAVIAIVAALVVTFAVIATVAETNVTVGGILNWLGDYVTAVGEALGNE